MRVLRWAFLMTIQPGDRVAVGAAVGVVKSVSAAGTVTLKQAVHGQRCFPIDQVALVETLRFAGLCESCLAEVEVVLHDCRTPESVNAAFRLARCPQCETLHEPLMVQQ